jgi:hypothetical protein
MGKAAWVFRDDCPKLGLNRKKFGFAYLVLDQRNLESEPK